MDKLETEFKKGDWNISAKLRFQHCEIVTDKAKPPFNHIIVTIYIPPICQKCSVLMSEKARRFLPPRAEYHSIMPSKEIELPKCPICGAVAPIDNDSKIIRIPFSLASL